MNTYYIDPGSNANVSKDSFLAELKKHGEVQDWGRGLLLATQAAYSEIVAAVRSAAGTADLVIVPIDIETLNVMLLPTIIQGFFQRTTKAA
jgi:hypothetical protein